MSVKQSDHHHGASHKQTVNDRVDQSHHSDGDHGFGVRPHEKAVDQAHHSGGAEGFMSPGDADCE